jgi:lipopolysaccharide transport system ATP-binding protein
MSDVIIKVEDLGKLYRLGEVGTGTISHDLNRWFARIRGKEDPFSRVGETNDRTSKGDSDYVWALKDIDFEVKKGEAIGIIGRNGAGKSTLLKILSKVTAPTKGNVKVKGRIASLLEVGTGFHPELTGRENIFLNGAILGMSKKEIKRKFDEIVDFAGVERYIDTPVKRYSSGMYVRLAFAVAAHLESEILIVDEVLAVGDAEFQRKCLGRMKDVTNNEGRTILFVSHNMAAVTTLCTRGLLMKNGRLTYASTMPAVIENYMQDSSGIDNPHMEIDIKNDEVSLTSIKILDGKSVLNNSFFSDMPITIEISYKVLKPTKNMRIIICLKSQDGINIFETSDVIALGSNVRQPGLYSSRLEMPSDLFNIGRYYISVLLDKPSEEKLFGPFEMPFNITELMNSQIGVTTGRPEGIIHPKLSWQVIKN